MNSIEILYRSFKTFLQETFKSSGQVLENISFSLNTQDDKAAFGDISSNAAMILAKELKTNPRTLAQTIAEQFRDARIATIEIAGPGFLNIFLTPETLQSLAHDIFTQKEQFFKLGLDKTKKNYNIEFVSANPTGPLHLGHGRGGIIGDVLGNVLRFIGHNATKEFYINDAGNQLQKLGVSFKARCWQVLNLEATIPEDGYQGNYLKDLAEQCVKEHGTSITTKPDTFFITYAKDHLLQAIKTTLADYGITFDVWFSEKTLHESGAIDKALALLQNRNYLYEKDGALWFKSTEFGDDKDRVVRKSTGELTYAAADIAYLENKLARSFDHLVLILGQDHHSYVVRLKGIMAALGHNPEQLDIILYQLVTLKEDGELVRMSKRAGKIATLKDIIEAVGTDVARFFYLNRKADAHLDFDIDLALKKTEENPVYYIQYAYVRTNSILQKAQEEQGLANITVNDLQNLNDDERMLIKKIVALKELLESIGNHYQTHLLTYYVLELAHAFHKYYSKNRVIDLSNMQQSRSRLAIIAILNNSFELCLKLLGISCPRSM